jgi:hypothetical protein
MPQNFLEEHLSANVTTWQNRAEGAIREVKTYAHFILAAENVPVRLWCFVFEYTAEMLLLTATGLYQLGGQTPYEHVMHTLPICLNVLFSNFMNSMIIGMEHRREKN